jgi:hypothetical protein
MKEFAVGILKTDFVLDRVRRYYLMIDGVRRYYFMIDGVRRYYFMIDGVRRYYFMIDDVRRYYFSNTGDLFSFHICCNPQYHQLDLACPQKNFSMHFFIWISRLIIDYKIIQIHIVSRLKLSICIVTLRV